MSRFPRLPLALGVIASLALATPLAAADETAGATAAGACTATAWSASAVYVGGNSVTYDGSEYTAAYWNQNAEPDKNSGAQYSGQPWLSPVSCSTPTCTPACSGKQCGSDGCGGTCGTCTSSQTCNTSDQCVTSCLPSCELKQCGNDGCGGTCGTCSAGLTCNPNNQCVAPCVPACSGKQCGGDTCGGSCGTCATGDACTTAGVCQAAAAPSSLAVPLYPQVEDEWCWAASAEMIMSYLGESVQQCAQANYRFGRTDCCTNASSESSTTECDQPGWPNWTNWGFTYSETAYGTALTFAQIQAEIAANRPVGFAWAWTGGGGHYMVATGTTIDSTGTQWVSINDPWAPNVGEQVTLTYADWVAGPAGVDPTATTSYTHMADDYGIALQN